MPVGIKPDLTGLAQLARRHIMSTITHERRERPSLFGPIVLIAIGLFFLFNRLNPITDLHWGDVLRLWPLFLVFLGLNILVQQAPRPLGTILSGLVALLAVGVFGAVLLVGLPGSMWGRANLEGWQTEEISFAAGDVTSAVMNLEIGPPGANLYALEDSQDLIAGMVTYQNALQFDKRGGNGRATVTLAPQYAGTWVWAPERWDDLGDELRWDLGLNPNIPMSLALTANAGASDLDLRGLMLQDLSLKIAASDVTVFLPGGDYDSDIETNAASTTITLPQSGQHTIELRVTAGSVTLNLPEGMEARIEVDQALGSFDDQNHSLQRTGTDNIWQTNGYEDSADRITLKVHIAVGSVTVR
jgi:hypothetical protein